MKEKAKSEIKNIMKEYQNFSYSKISQLTEGKWHETNSDIRWYSNEVGDFENENISEFYSKNSYGKKTRWDLWVDIVETLKEFGLSSILDIGAANNHFSFLCNKQNIFCVGVEPREDCIRSTSNIFLDTFGDDGYGYVGNLETFVDFFGSYDEKLFDCITILNFLHGNDHKRDEIEKLFEIFPKITSKILITNPQWDKLKLKDLTEDCKILKKFNDYSNHILYELGES